MRLITTTLAATFIVIGAGSALASDDDGGRCGAAGGQWLKTSAIAAKIEAKGYKVRKIERERNCYEVYAIGDQGRVELYVRPDTGDIVRTKTKSGLIENRKFEDSSSDDSRGYDDDERYNDDDRDDERS